MDDAGNFLLFKEHVLVHNYTPFAVKESSDKHGCDAFLTIKNIKVYNAGGVLLPWGKGLKRR